MVTKTVRFRDSIGPTSHAKIMGPTQIVKLLATSGPRGGKRIRRSTCMGPKALNFSNCVVTTISVIIVFKPAPPPNVHALLHDMWHQSLLYSDSKPSVNFIPRSFAIWLCCVVLYVRCSTVLQPQLVSHRQHTLCCVVLYVRCSTVLQPQLVSHRQHTLYEL
jgi:hypothetical protein